MKKLALLISGMCPPMYTKKPKNIVLITLEFYNGFISVQVKACVTVARNLWHSLHLLRSRTRVCSNPNGGCVGDITEMRECQLPPCVGEFEQ